LIRQHLLVGDIRPKSTVIPLWHIVFSVTKNELTLSLFNRRFFQGLSDIIRIKYTPLALLKAWLYGCDYQVANNANRNYGILRKAFYIFPCLPVSGNFAIPP